MTDAWKEWEGQVVNAKFRLRQYLGGSEHSAVFLTEHGELGLQKAAIKLIPADPRNAEVQLSYWKLAANLSHPHLIRLFEVGRCWFGNTEVLYVVMEYAEENLAQVLPHRPITPEEASTTLKPVLDALACLHSNGFVHSHLKPTNIMALDDQVKISSDGLCRAGESSGSGGEPGVYDPPEAVGEQISAAGDVWSLGMTLVEALTQRLPVWERAEQADPMLTEIVPEPFLDIARHCLRRDPQRRWTIAEIAARLLPAPIPPMLPKQMTARPPKAVVTRRYIVPTVAVGLVLAAILAGSRLLNRREKPQRANSIASRQQGVKPKPEQRAMSPEPGQSGQKPDAENQSSPGTAPSPVSIPSGAGAQAPTGVVRGEVLQQVLPDVPQKARATIRGTLRLSVRVAVDRSGRVVGATLDSPGPSRYFANLALQAARRWEFQPPKVDGRDASSEWVLRFDFQNTGTKVIAAQAAPQQRDGKQ